MCPSPSPVKRLLGPPGIRRPPPTPAAGGKQDAVPDDDILMDTDVHDPPEDGHPIPTSSGNRCLDFFFHVVPDTTAGTLTALLAAAWRQDPLTALKLVCHLRGVRGSGKSDREGFYTAAIWLHRHHPRTLALNVGSFAEFGYMKDLLEILHRLVDVPDARLWPPSAVSKKGRTTLDRRRRKRDRLAIRALERYAGDHNYQFLHDRVAEFFASLLSSDLDRLRSGDLKQIGLAAKWCPTLDTSFDRSTLICESIARRLFPRDSRPEYGQMEERHYAYWIRDRLRREVLVPLRKALELPEVFMTAGQWGSLPYHRVASVSMRTHKAAFLTHDEGYSSNFIKNVKEGKAKIAAGALLPHDILAAARDPNDAAAAVLAELHWRRMVEDLKARGALRNCIAVCDMGMGMSGEPMTACLALGLLVSELSEEPWKGAAITCIGNPRLRKIEGGTLAEKARAMSMNWGAKARLEEVFDLILRVAVERDVRAEEMVRTVLVFSGVEFDQGSWDDKYEAICRKFRESRYRSCVPEIVFWNLKDSGSTPPVAPARRGVALVSGFSKNMVKLFIEGGGSLSPEAVMEASICGEEYEKLEIFD